MCADAHAVRRQVLQQRDPRPCSSKWIQGRGAKSIAPEGCKQRDTVMGPAFFFVSLLQVLKRVREEFEPRGVEGLAWLNATNIGTTDIAPIVKVAHFTPARTVRGKHCHHPRQDGCFFAGVTGLPSYSRQPLQPCGVLRSRSSRQQPSSGAAPANYQYY